MEKLGSGKKIGLCLFLAVLVYAVVSAGSVVVALESDRVVIEDDLGNTTFKVTSEGRVDGLSMTLSQAQGESEESTKFSLENSSGTTVMNINAKGNMGIGEPASLTVPVVTRGSTFPVGFFARTTSLTGGSFDGYSGIASGYSLRTKTSGNMQDGFGGGILLSVQDNTSSSGYTQGTMARIYARRDGSDTNGALQFFTKGTNASSPTMTLRSSGNVGIGTSAPAAELEVDGGMRLNPVDASKPTCDPSARGTFWVTQGETDDVVEVCVMVSGALQWKPVW
ncbi:MAG: hypothetical protein C0617_07945 [Desulfuromonas sp.]|uniref:hypothetical protein n=1 Tax=Desulfuromonas sp. TaxID=892 RepID=UPI000CBE994B|nr:hypothetical protein [Desulfuromonas sp.]PLX84409.1 MAG: hypothetical protein C0617_07945 [Desulfuromonas sp.]